MALGCFNVCLGAVLELFGVWFGFGLVWFDCILGWYVGVSKLSHGESVGIGMCWWCLV